MGKKLYVGNLSYDMSDSDLQSCSSRTVRCSRLRSSTTGKRAVEGLRLCRDEQC